MNNNNKIYRQLAIELGKFGLFLSIILLFVSIYADKAFSWSPYSLGYKPYLAKAPGVEVLLVIVLASFLYFRRIENLVVRIGIPVICLLVLYAYFDVYYYHFSRIPSLSDWQNLAPVFEFSFWTGIATLVSVLIVPILFGVLLYMANRNCPKPVARRSIITRLASISLFLLFLNTETFGSFHQSHFNYTVWAQEDSIRDNGRVSSFLYYASLEKQNQQVLDEVQTQNKSLDVHAQLFPGEIVQPRNIHMLVMESFIDPRLLEDIEFSQPVIAKEMQTLLEQQGGFSLVISPIYGGGTAQAEFELLTGIPALSKVNRIEFNVMQGGQTDSFVNRLKQYNYQASATIAASSSFFNSKSAYQSIGFDQVEYLEETELFKDVSSKGPIFDGEVLEYNLAKVKRLLANQQQPIFNYVLGMYGHMPFRRNTTLRPDVSEISHSDERVGRIANQFYYRTKVIADYVRAIQKLDPNSIIYVTSDHLPSILGQEIRYKLDKNSNIAFLVMDGKTHDISGKHLYEVPWFVWDKLSGRDANRDITGEKLEALYYQFLAKSI